MTENTTAAETNYGFREGEKEEEKEEEEEEKESSRSYILLSRAYQETI